MKLQIKTLNQKSLLIDIDDEKTVYDLKQELAMFPDVGVGPELQKLIYAGKILSNDEQLSAYNIDVKKFLVVMILKQPEEEGAASTSTTVSVSTAATSTQKTESEESEAAGAAAGKAEFKTPPPPAAAAAVTARRDSKDELVQNIVSMGYPEGEVRRALEASFYSPERAIEYLIEGIPEAVSTTERAAIDFSDYTDDNEVTMSPIEVFRHDPLFRNLRRAIQQHPELIDDAIQRVGEANPAILHLINENQQEFLSMLVDASDGEDEEDEDESS